jgi:hypothetical protein
MTPRSRTLRLVRRLRALRRRQVRPRLFRVGRRLATLWREPARRSVAWQLRRVATAVEASIAVAGRLTAAEERLSDQLERIVDFPRPPRAAPSGYGPGGLVVPGTLSVAVALAVAALVLVAGNAWLLDRHLVPPVLAAGGTRFGIAPGLWLALTFSTLALVLGLFHYALFTAGRSVALRLLGALAVILLVAQGGVQAAATVVAVQSWVGVVVTSTWAGMGALVLIAGVAGLVPPVIGVTAHGAIDRFARWSAAREQRVVGRAVRARERLAGRMEISLHNVSRGIAALRAEAGSIPDGDVARLLVRPADGASVERLVMVLRRMAAGVERDPRTEPVPAGTLALRHLADVAALALWLVTASAALSIAAPAVASAMAGGGISGLVLSGVLGGLLALLVGGLLLRLLLDRPGRGPEPRAVAASIVLLTVAAVALALAIGSFAAMHPPFQGDPLTAAALLTLLVLTAALASTRLPEAIRAGGNAVRFVTGGAAWVGLSLADLALAAADLVLTGRRPAVRRPRRAHRGSSLARRTALTSPTSLGTLGGRPDTG